MFKRLKKSFMYGIQRKRNFFLKIYKFKYLNLNQRFN